jgi:hypothetical protein
VQKFRKIVDVGPSLYVPAISDPEFPLIVEFVSVTKAFPNEPAELKFISATA